MRKTKTLRNQMLVLLILAVLMPVAALTGFNMYSTNKNLRNQFEDTTADNVNWIVELIRETNKSNVESINMLSQDPNALAIFEVDSSGQWLQKSFESFMSTHKGVASVFYGLNDGKTIIAPSQDLTGFDPRTRQWYKSAVQANGNTIITDPYEDAVQKGTYVITFAKAVKDAKSGQILGVVGIDLKLSSTADIVKNLKIGQGGYAAIVDKTETIIAHKDSKLLGKTSKDQEWVTKVLSNKDNKDKISVDGNRYITYVAEEKDTGWKVIGFMPEQEVLNKINSSRNIALIISAVFLILSVLIGTIFAGSVTKPIIKLTEVLGKISKGDFTVAIDNKKGMSYEIEIIANAINKMVQDIVSVIKNISNTSMSIKSSSEALVSITQQSNAVGEEVARAVQQVSAGAQDQAESLDESSAVVGVLGEEVIKAIENSNEMVAVSQNVKVSTEDGTHIVENLRDTFTEAFKANKELEQQINVLADNSNKISAITDTIKAITEQTSLLALNASIEAARAGEAGRGFAVVADEVRKLAEQSASSAGDINKVIIDIKKSVDAVLERVQLSIALNEKSEKSVMLTNSSFEIIEESSKLLEENIKKVNESLQEINRSKETVVQKIAEVAAVAQETAATTEEVSASSEEQSAALQEVVGSAEQLSNLAESLDEILKKFTI
ncbi:methyl-accepting chemotaxis protein [Clostridium swellfunianum]|uniref:methyl-accepting chemotaxis protein n=1 Tax=Clostridium swellfunianum TaxID=1367462 RepID=UPI002030F29B|nr:methyl-accepting chemotaxis protein [Clostridium swellfunianum]MCM0649173.1 methyl-accepting chemotaxis protein [Clostridium swellfunianum]